MISSHAVGLAALGAESFFRSPFWFPRGWAAPCFLFLTGITAAVASDGNPRWVNGARKRALKVLAVMVGSNLTFLTCKYALTGQLAHLTNPWLWPRLLTFEADATISAILLPIVLVTSALPYVLAVRDRLPVTFGCLAAGVYVGAWALCWTSGARLVRGPLMSALFTSGVDGFQVVPLMSNALVGVTLGRLLPSYERLCAVRRSMFAVFLVALVVALSSLTRIAIVQVTVGSLLRLAVVFVGAVSILLCAPAPLAKTLSRLGQFGLFVFIAHRRFVHAVFFTTSTMSLTPPVRYVTLFSTTLAAVVLLCALRCRFEPFDRAMRIVYL